MERERKSEEERSLPIMRIVPVAPVAVGEEEGGYVRLEFCLMNSVRLGTRSERGEKRRDNVNKNP